LRQAFLGTRRGPGIGAHVLVVSWALLFACLAGCTSAARISQERLEDSIAAGDPRVLVVPLNISVALASGLDVAVEPVQKEILAHLAKTGARVGFLAVEDAHELWRHTVRTMRSHQRNTASLEAVAGTFVRSLTSETKFDILVMPSLGYREARVERGYAIWDGVQRSLTARHQQWALTKRIPAFSLHTQLYLPDGRLWTQRWAGLDLVYPSGLESESELRAEQLRRNRDLIREGVARALSFESS
jgi:hypothetical protein